MEDLDYKLFNMLPDRFLFRLTTCICPRIIDFSDDRLLMIITNNFIYEGQV